LFILLSFNISLQAQGGKTFQSNIEDSILKQMKIYPQEKIHLHLDRDIYVPGEKIWFKAYVTDAATHHFPTYSRYVYVELINSIDSLVTRVMVRQENEMFYGHLFLSEAIPEGHYTVRAYTRNIENLGDDYFFKKNIRIGSFQDEKEIGKKKKTQPKTKDNYDVSFFPEGGNLLDGVLCRIAFKALNENGYSETISGEVIDENGKTIAEAKTIYAGMGSFAINAEKGKQYFLECQNSKGTKKRFRLPVAEANKYTISTIWNYSSGKLIISRNKSVNSPDISQYLLIHCGGVLFYFAEWEKDKEYIIINEDQAPSGVVQLLLLDQDMNPISERLVFIKTKDELDVLFSTDKTVYEKRDLVSSSIKLSDFYSNHPGGNLSVAITDDKDISVDSLTTINSSLLLSSELKGYIETPAYYLQESKNASYALDHLMMINGWRRYNIPEVIKGRMAIPEKPMEMSKEITGEVKSLILGKPVVNAEVFVMNSMGEIGQSETNEKGEFSFTDFDFPDSTKFFVQSLNKKGKPNVELIVKEKTFPTLKKSYHHSDEIFSVEESKNKVDDFMEKAIQRAKYDEDMRFVQLKEVEVTAKRPEKKEETRLRYWANSSSDVTLRRSEIEKWGITRTEDLLRSIGGVIVSENKVYFTRTMNISFSGSVPALIILDGMIVEDLESVYHIYDIESIDIFKGGASSTVFGSRGAGGAISITTKIGGGSEINNKALNIAVLFPLGYQAPVEFYSPKYDTPDSKYLSNPDYRTTIFWKPDIVINGDEEAKFNFYTSDIPSTYSVVIEGLSNDGRIIRRVEKIEVK